MADMDYFKRFIPKEEKKEKINRIVWSYTRVSSKEQFEKNSSIERQIEANRDYARKNDLHIEEEFGGTYESGKTDFTRAEFSRLIDKVKASRKKPYAILVFKMSRFSRSGAKAIGIVDMLVDELGVNLIEVSTGMATTTERGKAAIYDSLFVAFKENLDKKELVHFNMQAYLRTGRIAGQCPVGYDHYGPRVRNEKFLSLTQRIEINKDGELLKEAWQWKVSGHYSDAQILARLAARGLHLLPQKLSKIWRNPFYCGILIHKTIDKPVEGTWPPLITQEDFKKVQDILEGNLSGYQHNKEQIERPLLRLLRCDGCKGYLVGYRNKKKNLHYYRCLRCKGVSLNAHTTQKAKRTGANDLFLDFLENFSVPKPVVPLVKLQLTKLYDHYNKDGGNDDALKTQLSGLETKRRDLQIRHGMGDIDKETYRVTLDYLENQIQVVSKELEKVAPRISNLENLLESSLEKLQNLRQIWGSGDLESKRRLQTTLFPDGIYYNVEKHRYLTEKINEFVRASAFLARVSPEKEKGNFQAFLENSLFVPRTGIEPVIHP